MQLLRNIVMMIACLTLMSCGFHLQGPAVLSPTLKHVYLKSNDPYGRTARNIREYLKMSDVIVTATPEEATTILNITRESNDEQLLSVSGTQQTRQYKLSLTIVFEITDPKGVVLVPEQGITESRTLTVQSNQVLAGGNEASRLFDDMRRAIAYDLMNRLSSTEVTKLLNTQIVKTKPRKKSS